MEVPIRDDNSGKMLLLSSILSKLLNGSKCFLEFTTWTLRIGS